MTKAQTKRFKSGHVIEEYSVSKNTIECLCGWKGDADEEWKQHKLEMKYVPVERESWRERNRVTGQIPF